LLTRNSITPPTRIARISTIATMPSSICRPSTTKTQTGGYTTTRNKKIQRTHLYFRLTRLSLNLLELFDFLVIFKSFRDYLSRIRLKIC
jgi:hypothetical protein